MYYCAKNMAKTIHWFITLLLLGFTVYMLYSMHETTLRIDELKKLKPEHSFVNTKNEDIEVVHYMQRIQFFHLKLYFAGKANNNELVKFYLHEIEEEMEALEQARITDDDINISRSIKQIGLPALENFENGYKSNPQNFELLFADFTQACNTCHTAVKYPEIKIKVPEFNPFSNQEFIAR